MKKKYLQILKEVIACSLTLIILVPLYILVINSFKNAEQAGLTGIDLPSGWHIIENYTTLFKAGNILMGFKTSVIVTVISVFFTIMITSMAAFVLQRKKTRLSNMIFMIILVGMFLPESLIISYFILKFFGLTGTYVAAILVYINSTTPLNVFFYYGSFKNIPRELDESAIMDGCGPYKMFFKIIFPLVKPVTVTVLIISCMTCWNDFRTALWFLNSPKTFTLVMTLYSFYGEHRADWNLVFADIVVISLPIVLVYLLLQKHVVSGMTSGAIKG